MNKLTPTASVGGDMCVASAVTVATGQSAGSRERSDGTTTWLDRRTPTHGLPVSEGTRIENGLCRGVCHFYPSIPIVLLHRWSRVGQIRGLHVAECTCRFVSAVSSFNVKVVNADAVCGQMAAWGSSI